MEQTRLFPLIIFEGYNYFSALNHIVKSLRSKLAAERVGACVNPEFHLTVREVFESHWSYSSHEHPPPPPPQNKTHALYQMRKWQMNWIKTFPRVILKELKATQLKKVRIYKLRICKQSSFS